MKSRIICLIAAAACILPSAYGREIIIHQGPRPKIIIEHPGRRPRPGAVWVPGHWRHRHGDWIWIPGHWRLRR